MEHKDDFFFTFGQQYRDEQHPKYNKAHPDGWVRIQAVTDAASREKGFELFGPHFATSYPLKHFNSEYFPKGEIEFFEV